MKKYFLGFFALTLAFAMSAFTAPTPKTLQWFKRVNNGSITNPQNFLIDQGTPCNDLTGDVCGVYANPDGSGDHPDFDGSEDYRLKQQ